MKQTVEQLGQQASFDAAVEWQAKPITISGDVEVIEQAHVQAEQYVRSVKQDNVAPTIGKRLVRAPEAPQRPVYVEPSIRDKAKQWIADGHVRRFDKAHGSNLYAELQEKRRRDALFLKAAEVGLIGDDSLYYKRKLGTLAKV